MLILPPGAIRTSFQSDLVQAIPVAEKVLESISDGNRTTFSGSFLIFRNLSRASEIVLDSIVAAVLGSSDLNVVTQLVNDFINLFTKKVGLTVEEIKGFFGELAVLEMSKSPIDLIACWHESTNERFDFNSGPDRLEVKISFSPTRVHHFSSSQLPAPRGVNVQIVSMMSQLVPNGIAIFDLYQSLRQRLDSIGAMKLDSLFTKFVSRDEPLCESLLFDYDMAKGSIAIYDSDTIPRPVMAPGVISASWESELTYINPAQTLIHISKMVIQNY
jgi:hypothetical protein